MSLFNQAHAYSKIENKDTEEAKHRLAQLLIYKAMKKADHIARRKRPSWLRVKILKLKIKVGHRLKIRKKDFSSTAFSAKADFCKQMSRILRSCKHMLVAKQDPIVRTLPTSMF